MNDIQLGAIFHRAATGVMLEWCIDEGVDDLVNDLWVRYLESPETQKKFAELTRGEAIKSARGMAVQLLSKRILSGNTFADRNLYSSEAIKDALKGNSTNHYLLDILPVAMKNLESRHETYVEALRSRYEDGIVPHESSDQDALKRAHKAITEEVNILVFTADPENGAGSRAAVFPDSCKPKGLFSDPTGTIALTLLEHPEAAEEFAGETPIYAVVEGAHVQPTYTKDGLTYREYYGGN